MAAAGATAAGYLYTVPVHSWLCRGEEAGRMGGLDIARGVMEVAGSVPAVGAAHDAATIPKSDEGNVALSAVSAVPVVGDAAQVAGKSLKLEEKDSRLTENAASKAKKMASLMGSLKGKMKTGAKKIRNKISRKDFRIIFVSE